MLTFIVCVLTCGLPKACFNVFDPAPVYSTDIVNKSIEQGKSLIVGNGLELEELARLAGEDKLYCIGDEQFPDGVTELVPINRKLFFKPKAVQPTEQVYQVKEGVYGGYFQSFSNCPNCRR